MTPINALKCSMIWNNEPAEPRPSSPLPHTKLSGVSHSHPIPALIPTPRPWFGMYLIQVTVGLTSDLQHERAEYFSIETYLHCTGICTKHVWRYNLLLFTFVNDLCLSHVHALCITLLPIMQPLDTGWFPLVWNKGIKIQPEAWSCGVWWSEIFRFDQERVSWCGGVYDASKVISEHACPLHSGLSFLWTICHSYYIFII